MSFRCQKCKRLSWGKQHKIVVKRRHRIYREHSPPRDGWEIVKEINVCENCKGDKK